MEEARTSPLVLGIETSCDDTACAVLDGDGRVLSSAVSSQMKAHRPYGGVVPEIASREHLANWPAVHQIALAEAGVTLNEIDVFAATRGPGLVGSLLVGLSLGRAMAYGLNRDFHAMHHLEGHVYSPFLALDGQAAAPIPERFVGLVVSGGHASLLSVEGGEIRSLVETRDDAMGEVFDKVGKRIGLTYPQGPKVDALSEQGDPDAFPMTVPKIKTHLGKKGQGLIKDDIFFSFSGLKSEALRCIEKLERQGVRKDPDDLDAEALPQPLLDVLASFRHAAVKQILHRVRRLHRERSISTLAVSGGAAANRLLRRELTVWAEETSVDLKLVPLKYSGDNAAMIAFATLLAQRRGLRGDPRHAIVASRLPFRPIRED